MLFCIIRLNAWFLWIRNNVMAWQLITSEELSFCAIISVYQISRIVRRYVPSRKAVYSKYKLKQSLSLSRAISTKALSACMFKTPQMKSEEIIT